MSAFAHVGQTDLLCRYVNITIGDYGQDYYRVRQADGTYLHVPENTECPPTISLRDDEAHALLEELLRHYQGSENTRQLRKDYEAERARVDKLIDRWVK